MAIGRLTNLYIVPPVKQDQKTDNEQKNKKKKDPEKKEDENRNKKEGRIDIKI